MIQNREYVNSPKLWYLLRYNDRKLSPQPILLLHLILYSLRPYTIFVAPLYNICCTLILYSLRPKRFIGSIILTETPCTGHPPPSNACSLATNASKACCPSVSTDSTCSKYHSELSVQVSTQAFFLSIKRSFTSGRHERTTAIPMSDSKKHQSIFIIFVSC